MVAKELRGHTVAKPSLATDRPAWRSPGLNSRRNVIAFSFLTGCFGSGLL